MWPPWIGENRRPRNAVACISHSIDGRSTVLDWSAFRDQVAELTRAFEFVYQKQRNDRCSSIANLLALRFVISCADATRVPYWSESIPVESIRRPKCPRSLPSYNSDYRFGSFLLSRVFAVAPGVKTVVLTTKCYQPIEVNNCDLQFLGSLLESPFQDSLRDELFQGWRSRDNRVYVRHGGESQRVFLFGMSKSWRHVRAVSSSYSELGPDDSTICGFRSLRYFSAWRTFSVWHGAWGRTTSQTQADFSGD